MKKPVLVIAAFIAVSALSMFGFALAMAEYGEYKNVQIVKKHLKDPESAKFESLMKGKDGGLCGYVNARNSMGGYSGLHLFYVTKLGTVMFAPDVQTYGSIESRIRSLEVKINFLENLNKVCDWETKK